MSGPARRLRATGVLLPSSLVLALTAVACGDGPSEARSTCVTASGASICAARNGAIRLETAGLQPGSTLAVTTPGGTTRTTTFTVGGGGELTGAVAVLAADTSAPVSIEVEGVAVGGTPIEGRLEVGPEP